MTKYKAILYGGPAMMYLVEDVYNGLVTRINALPIDTKQNRSLKTALDMTERKLYSGCALQK